MGNFFNFNPGLKLRRAKLEKSIHSNVIRSTREVREEFSLFPGPLFATAGWSMEQTIVSGYLKCSIADRLILSDLTWRETSGKYCYKHNRFTFNLDPVNLKAWVTHAV